jgi:3-phenylpropionate/cinnamic acid dioxygenase small subunit
VSLELHHLVERFLFHEARLMDEHRYEEWERYWSDDGVYWVPAFHGDYDPDERVSIIYDQRAGIAARVKRLSGHHAYAQQPKTRLLRTVSNVEVRECSSAELLVESNFVLSAQRQEDVQVWSGRSTHRLRLPPDRATAEWEGWRICYKKVSLVPLEIPLANMSFLL